MEPILRNTGAQREVTFEADGTATAADGAVTVTVVGGDGATVTTATASNLGSGRYRYILDPQATLNRLTERWAGTFSGVAHTLSRQAEIVGAFYAAMSEIRSQAGLSDTTRYTPDEIAKTREWFERKFEKYTGVAWAKRYRRVRLNGSGRSSLILPDLYVRKILSVRVYSDASTYTAFTSTELADLTYAESGIVTRAGGSLFTSGTNNVVVEYEHGGDPESYVPDTVDPEVPSDIREAALVAIRDKLLSDQIGSRQYSVVTELGNVRFVLAGPGRPFGIPFVDEVANARRQVVPAIA